MIGSRIRHPSLGIGMVVGETDDALHVRFDRDGASRWIVKSFPVEQIDEDLYPHAQEQQIVVSADVSSPSQWSHASQLESPSAEAGLIVKTLRRDVLSEWDGRRAVLAMRDGGSTNWRQMEWIGFYFEHLCRTSLWTHIGGRTGPSYVNTTFDYERTYVWDLKAHPVETKELIVNDAAAFRACLADRGTLGVVIVEGKTLYDDTGEFKRWHDVLKGGVSTYERDRVARGAPSRRRKLTFQATDCYAIVFEGVSDLDGALTSGWVRDRFQSGMRNSNGTPRPPKVTLVPQAIPPDRLIR